MRPIVAALLLLLAAPVRADVLDDFIEEQRIAERDDVNLPPHERVEDESAVDSVIREQRCVERALEIGLSPEAAEEWCSR